MTQSTVATIKIVAEGLGVNPHPDATRTLAAEVDFRLRETIQDAAKFMRHGKRTHLTTSDINAALRLRNYSSIFGLSGRKNAARFLQIAGHPDMYYLDDPIVSLAESRYLSSPPSEIGLIPHWLAVDGKQPKIPENIPLKHRQSAKRPRAAHVPPLMLKSAHALVMEGGEAKATEAGADVGGQESILVRAPIRHVLPQELQAYYDTAKALLAGDKEGISAEALARQNSALLTSLATDAGLQPLASHLVTFITEQVAEKMTNKNGLILLVNALKSMLKNEFLDLGHCLHDVLPALLTILLTRQMGNMDADDDHWVVREAAASALAVLCKKFVGEQANVGPRVQKILLKELTATSVSSPPSKQGLSTVYGAIQGLSAQGPRVVKALLLPQLRPVMNALESFMDTDSQSSDALARVKEALMEAVVLCVQWLQKTQEEAQVPRATVEELSDQVMAGGAANELAEAWREEFPVDIIKKVAISLFGESECENAWKSQD